MLACEGHQRRVRLALAGFPLRGMVVLHGANRPFETEPMLPLALASVPADSHRWPIRPGCRLPLESGG